MGGRTGWVEEVYRIVERALDHDWDEHLRLLNARYDLSIEHRFSTHGVGEPPTFFNGDLDALEPGRWTLVISLNPHQVMGVDMTAASAPERRFASAAAYWDFWRTYNADTWYGGFYGPLVRVAAGALGDAVPREKEREYATTRMLFLELCPYASPRFGLSPQQVAELGTTDKGFGIARSILDLAMERGRSALILVNGNPAVDALGAVDEGRIAWSPAPQEYQSASKPDKRLHHWQGAYRAEHGVVPVAGFPFLRTMRGFNSNVELAQLAERLRAFVANPIDGAA